MARVCKTTLCNKLLQTANLTKCADCELSEFNAKQLETEHNHSTMQEVDYICAADSRHVPTHNVHTRGS